MDFRNLTIFLKVVGKNSKIDKPDKDGFKSMKFFSKGKGRYQITFRNDQRSPTLRKFYKKSIGIVPYIDESVIIHLLSGGKAIIDNDVVKIARVEQKEKETK